MAKSLTPQEMETRVARFNKLESYQKQNFDAWIVAFGISTQLRDLKVVESVAAQVFIPLTVGGGIRSVQDIRRLLNAGADKVSVNTAAVRRPELISELSAEFKVFPHAHLRIERNVLRQVSDVFTNRERFFEDVQAVGFRRGNRAS